MTDQYGFSLKPPRVKDVPLSRWLEYVYRRVTGLSLFSTSETFSGQFWIDGKPIYRKCVAVTLPNASDECTAHRISNIDSIVRLYGMAKNSTPSHITLPFVDHDGSGRHVEAWANNTNIRLETNYNWSTISGYVVLEYTKT
jgi:hypothetical protein